MNQTFSNRYLILVVFIFTLASTFSIIDRQILNVMIGPIKRDLGGISDTQVSLIMGFAFALFYTLMTYPAGRIADRYNRIKLMTASISPSLTGFRVRSQSCDHFFTSFALGTVTSREVGFIKPTLAQIVAVTLGYLDS